MCGLPTACSSLCMREKDNEYLSEWADEESNGEGKLNFCHMAIN